MTKNLNVALVRGPIISKKGSINNEATPCIALAYISGYLRKFGYQTRIVDAIQGGLNQSWPLESRKDYFCQGLNFEDTIALIPKNSDVIGFSGMFSGEWPALRELITLTRKQFPNALLVAGGEHISSLTEYSLRDCPALDACVKGEGEHTFYQLIKSYRSEGHHNNIEGVAYLDKEGNYCQSDGKNPRIKNIDTIPWPDWPEGYLEKFWEAKKSYGVATGRDMPLTFSRGCPYKCTFCSNDQMYTNRYILRDLDDVMAEIKHYIKKYNINSVQLYDLTAITKKSWTVEFCNRLLDEGIDLIWSLPSGTRSEALDAETLGLLKKSGCHYLVYAPETGSPEMLIKIKKKTTIPKITASIEEAKRQGLTLRTNLICAFPDETWKNVRETVLYGLKLSLKGVEEVSLNIFSPYPGTEIFQNLQAENRITINDDYFFSLTSLNSSYFQFKSVASYNPRFAPWKISLIRLTFMMTTYSLSYICFPKRIFRLFKNVVTNNASTVFEQRMLDFFKIKKKKELEISHEISEK